MPRCRSPQTTSGRRPIDLRRPRRRHKLPYPDRGAGATGGSATAARGLHVEAPTPLPSCLAAATSYNGYDRSPAATDVIRRRDARTAISRCARAKAYDPASRRISRSCGAVRACHARSGPAPRPPAAPTDERIRDWQPTDDPQLVDAAVPVRALSADRLLAAGHPAGQPAGHLERARAPAVELQLDDQYQYPDELLAGRVDQSGRMPSAAVRPDRRPDRQRRAGPPRSTTAAAAGSRTTTPTCGARSAPVGRLRRGDPVWAMLADGRRLALPAPLGALRFRRRRSFCASAPIP